MGGGIASTNAQWVIANFIVLTPGDSALDGNLMNVDGVLVIMDPSTLIFDGLSPYSNIESCLSSSPRLRWLNPLLFSSSESIS